MRKAILEGLFPQAERTKTLPLSRIPAEPFIAEELMEALGRMKAGKATGPHNIPAEAVKMAGCLDEG